jgi:peroxiredoxin
MRRIMTFVGGLLLGLGLGAMLLFGVWRDRAPARISSLSLEAEPRAAPEIGERAPAFELAALSGANLSLAGLRGSPVILNFWATWCAPCRLEMPLFQQCIETSGGALRVVAVNAGENPDVVQAFVDELGLTLDVLLDPSAEVQRLYQVRGYPTTYLIDAEGTIRIHHLGVLTEAQLDAYLEQLNQDE